MLSDISFNGKSRIEKYDEHAKAFSFTMPKLLMRVAIIDTSNALQKKELNKALFKHKEKVLIYNFDQENRAFPINKSACNFNFSTKDSILKFYNIQDIQFFGATYEKSFCYEKSLPVRNFKIIQFNKKGLHLLDVDFTDERRVLKFKLIK